MKFSFREHASPALELATATGKIVHTYMRTRNPVLKDRRIYILYIVIDVSSEDKYPPTVSSLKDIFVTTRSKNLQTINVTAMYQQASRLVTQTQTCQEYSRNLFNL